MAKAVKLADIAERLSVSTVTVSKALSGQKGVSEEMREKIKSLAEELGYQQPSARKSQNAGNSYNIGVLIATRYMGLYESLYWQMYQQVATKAVSKGCFTLMEAVGEKEEKNGTVPILIQEQKADSLIIIGRMQDEYLKALNRKASVPILYLDFCTEDRKTDAVISDSYYGAYRLTNYLFDMGHHKIGYIGTILSTGSKHPIHCHCGQSCSHLTVWIVFFAVFVRFPSIGSRKQLNHSCKSYTSVYPVLIDLPRSSVSCCNKMVVLSNYRSGCCIACHWCREQFHRIEPCLPVLVAHLQSLSLHSGQQAIPCLFCGALRRHKPE